MRPEFSRLERPIIVNIDRLLMLLVFVQVLPEILEIKELLARSTGGMLQSSLKTMEKATFSVTSDNLREGLFKLLLLLLVFVLLVGKPRVALDLVEDVRLEAFSHLVDVADLVLVLS